MKIGDSFLFPEWVQAKSCRAMAYSVGRRMQRKFIVRKVEDGLRCWRVED
jgi:hypothetical protein